MPSTLAIFLLLLTITAVTPSNWSTILAPLTKPNYNPAVINELNDFLTLIPQTTIDEVVAKYFVISGDFRHAVKFLRSSDFKQLIQEAEEVPEILEILEFLHLLTVQQHQSDFVAHQKISESQMANGACELMRLQSHLENTIDNINVQIELLPYSGEDTAVRQLGSFTSFVEELLGHLPRESYVSMIEEKRKRNTDFAEFYTALRSPSLQPMADAAMVSSREEQYFLNVFLIKCFFVAF